jgi:hypothetical protein
VPQVTDEDDVVLQGRPATAAANGVRRVREFWQSHPRILDTKVDDSGRVELQRSDQRIVRVERQGCGPGQRPEHRLPAISDLLQLAVAIQLIPEQVHQPKRPRWH